MEFHVHKNDGTSSAIQLNDEVFKINVNEQAIFDVVISKNASLRQGTHSTLTKSEVSGGGRKPWKQKHTGRARAGSIRSPIWRGGGVAFGPKPTRNYELKINKKVYKLAMKSALTLKAQNNEIVIVESFVLDKISTKEALAKIANLKLDPKFKKILIVNEDNNVVKSIRNLQQIETSSLKGLDVNKILNADVIIFEQHSIEKLTEVLQ